MVKALDRVEIIGKKKPFRIRKSRGLYLYISADQLSQLIKINEEYKSLYKTGIEPIDKIKVVGRGGAPGFKPFLFEGKRTLCVLADQLTHLKKINIAYGELLELKKKKKERRKLEEIRREEERKKKYKKRETEIEIEKVKKAIADARYAGALKYTPKLMHEVERSFAETEKAFDAVEYDRAVELSVKTLKLAKNAKKEARKIKKLRKAREKRPKYFYCLIPSDGEGVSLGEGVYTIPYKDIAAVVSDTTFGEYEMTDENIETHEEVMRKVLEDHTPLPVEFGTVIKNERILKSIMKRAYRTMKESLSLLDNKVELGVKAILTNGTAKFNDTKRKEFLKESSRILEEIAMQSTKGRLFSKRLLLNASFLVDRGKIGEFSEGVGKLAEKYKQLNFQYSGPWAPYNFVYIRIGAKGIQVMTKEDKVRVE